MLNTLPVEISFVDQDDRVRYFSHENHAKIFPRTRGVIGVPVQQCHPQKSLHVVNAILRDFKAGTRKVAEFWIDMAGKKIHIRYFPVHGAKGEYLGTMEVVQDVTEIQKLTGERRLLLRPEVAGVRRVASSLGPREPADGKAHRRDEDQRAHGHETQQPVEPRSAATSTMA